MLRKAFLFDRSLYGELSRAAYAATRDFLREHFPALEGAVPAMVAAPQSHGSLLNFHPHLHALSSLGVFDREGRFHPAPEDLDFSPLEELFRERTLEMMLQSEVLSEQRTHAPWLEALRVPRRLLPETPRRGPLGPRAGPRLHGARTRS